MPEETKSILEDIFNKPNYEQETKYDQIYSFRNKLESILKITDPEIDSELIEPIKSALRRISNLKKHLILILEEIQRETKPDSFTEELLENLIKLVEDIDNGDKIVERFERLRSLTNKNHRTSLNLKKEEVFKEVYDLGFEEGFRAAREIYNESNRIDINDDLLD